MLLATTTFAQAQTVRIGTFDSRAVALAYYNSADYKASLNVKRSPQQNEAFQALKHIQVFSHASIPNVTDKLEDIIPAVAKDAGVSLVVSEWEIVWRDPNVEYVDVTAKLVDAFKPDQRVQKWVESLKKQKPLALVDVAMMPHKE